MLLYDEAGKGGGFAEDAHSYHVQAGNSLIFPQNAESGHSRCLQNVVIPEAMSKAEEIQPVEPAPVETRAPLEDCISERCPQAIRYRGKRGFALQETNR